MGRRTRAQGTEIWVGRFAGVAIGLFLVGCVELAHAGGPRWVAGSSFFDPSVNGQPVIWSGGQVTYYVDVSALSPVYGESKAADTVGDAASIWNRVTTAAVAIQYGGKLAENVDSYLASHNGALPADIVPTATNKPVAVVFDETGAVINSIYGTGASSPLACQNNGVMASVDNVSTSGTIAHALILVNGLCVTTANPVNLEYQLIRAFGVVLGLDWSQANEAMFASGELTSAGLAGWPVMHPVERLCSGAGGTCLPNDTVLRTDDIAALNRLYPVTAANLACFPGKTVTGQSTISVQGTIEFAMGQGMQGVNVVLQPLVNGVPDPSQTVTAVSGVYFQGNQGNPVTGPNDSQGNPLNRYGSDDPALEGYFDLSGVPLPQGVTTADYQLTFEAINSEYTGGSSVGPYRTGQVTPSGTMPVITLPGLSAGSAVTENVVIGDSPDEAQSGADGTESVPANVPGSGEWTGRMTGYGHSGWFQFRARGSREFTIEAQALDETGANTENKAQLVMGAWNGTDATGTLPVTGTAQAFNGAVTGLTTLPVLTIADSEVRMGLADARGDGRPDYAYRGRILYADSVTPAVIPVSGGQVVIRGMGFRPSVMVTVNGLAAQVTSVTPTAIVAMAPASGGATGTVPIVVQDAATLGVAAISAGFSYDAGTNHALAMLNGPSGSVPIGVPEALTVRAINTANGAPAAGVTVTYAIAAGTAVLGCGQTTCSAVTAGDGTATLPVTATAAAMAEVTASLTNGSSVTAQFMGTAPPSIVALTPNLYIAMGATVAWPVQALLLDVTGTPVAGEAVNWAAAGDGVSLASGQTTSGPDGMTQNQITAGPFSSSVASAVTACLAGNLSCASLSVTPVQPATAGLVAWSGTAQYVGAGQAFAPVELRVVDAFGDPVAGATVTMAEAFYGWTEPCPSGTNCAPAPLLEQQMAQATSGLDGTVTLTPLPANGLAGRLLVTAVTGTSTTLSFELDAHP